MYELWIKKPDGVWHQLDLGDEKPAITIQRNNIAEMKSRQTDYSQALKLPMTDKNRRIFDYSDIFEVVTELRHKVFECVLYSNQYEIAAIGSRLLFVSIDDYFRVQILGSEKTFFNAISLDGKTLNDLIFTDEIPFNKTGVDLSNPNNNRNLFFGIADFSTDPSGAGSLIQIKENGEIQLIYNYQGQIPFFKYKTIIEKIVQSAGYTLDTDISEDVEYKNACIPLATMFPKIDISAIKNNRYVTQSVYIIVNGAFLNSNASGSSISSYYSLKFGHTYYNPITNFSIYKNDDMQQVFAYTAQYKGLYTFRITLNISSTGGQYITPFVKRTISTSNWSDLILSETSGYNNVNSDWNVTVNLEIGEIFYFSFGVKLTGQPYGALIGNWSSSGFAAYVDDFIPTQLDFAKQNQIIPVKGNLPEFTQHDFFKEFLKIYGLTFNVDDKTKTVYARTLNYINGQKLNAIDWSKKYQKNTGTKKFTLGEYARKNWILYKNEELDVDKEQYFFQISEGIAKQLFDYGTEIYYFDWSENIVKLMNSNGQFLKSKEKYFVISLKTDKIIFEDKGFIPADDEIIKPDYNMIEIFFESCETIQPDTEQEGYYAKIRKYEYNKDAPADSLFNKKEINKLCLFRDKYRFNDGGLLYFIGTNTNSGYSVQAQALADKYYKVLKDNILSDMRVIEDAEFLLTPQDIQNFDPFVPIYLDVFGAYFYVNKIKNFVAGNLTNVDLVKM